MKFPLEPPAAGAPPLKDAEAAVATALEVAVLDGIAPLGMADDVADGLEAVLVFEDAAEPVVDEAAVEVEMPLRFPFAAAATDPLEGPKPAALATPPATTAEEEAVAAVAGADDAPVAERMYRLLKSMGYCCKRGFSSSTTWY